MQRCVTTCIELFIVLAKFLLWLYIFAVKGKVLVSEGKSPMGELYDTNITLYISSFFYFLLKCFNTDWSIRCGKLESLNQSKILNLC